MPLTPNTDKLILLDTVHRESLEQEISIFEDTSAHRIFTTDEKKTLSTHIDTVRAGLYDFYELYYDYATPKFFYKRSQHVRDLQKANHHEIDDDDAGFKSNFRLTAMIAFISQVNLLRIYGIFLRFGGIAIDEYVGEQHCRASNQGNQFSQLITAIGPLANYLSVIFYVLRLVPDLLLMFSKLIWIHDDLISEKEIRWKIFWAELRKRNLNDVNLGTWGIVNGITNFWLLGSLGLQLTAIFLLFDILLALWERYRLAQVFDHLIYRLRADSKVDETLRNKLLICVEQRRYETMATNTRQLTTGVALVISFVVSYAPMILAGAVTMSAAPYLLVPAIALTAIHDKQLALAMAAIVVALILIASPQLTMIAGMVISMGCMGMLMSGKEIKAHLQAQSACHSFILSKRKSYTKHDLDEIRRSSYPQLRESLDHSEQKEAFDQLIEAEHDTLFWLRFEVVVMKTLIPLALLVLCSVCLPAGLTLSALFIGFSIARHYYPGPEQAIKSGDVMAGTVHPNI